MMILDMVGCAPIDEEKLECKRCSQKILQVLAEPEAKAKKKELTTEYKTMKVDHLKKKWLRLHIRSTVKKDH